MITCPVRVAALETPDGPAWMVGKETLTWREVETRVSAWTSRLDSLGVRPGDGVGILAWNKPETVSIWFAAGRLGAYLVPFNSRLTANELGGLRAEASPRVVFADDELREKIPGSLPFDPPGPGGGPADALVDEGATFALLFTSGTTGVPKPVRLTHSNFQANALASAVNLRVSRGDRWQLTLPLFHIGGLAMAYRVAVYGAGLVIDRAFDARRTNDLVSAGKVSHLSLVATGLERLLDVRGAIPFPSSVKTALIGGGPVPPPLLRRARALDLLVLQTYGLTEACSQVTTERPSEADGTTAGHPLPGITVTIFSENGSLCPTGQVGEIGVTGPTVSRELGPLLRTKDLGSLDDRGRLTIASRRTDLIVSGGENIYPAEIELVLASHPAIQEAAVVSKEDSRWGQVPVAAIVLRSRQSVSVAELIEFARSRLAGFKIPKGFEFIDELPRNALGKIDRVALRMLFE